MAAGRHRTHEPCNNAAVVLHTFYSVIHVIITPVKHCTHMHDLT